MLNLIAYYIVGLNEYPWTWCL